MSNSGISFEPSFQFAVCTPSNTANLTYKNADGIVEEKRCKALYIGSIAGGAGLTIKDDAGNNVAFAGLVAGSVYPISTYRVMSTGTTCSSIVALY